MPPIISQETMDLLRSHLGQKVILTRTLFGEEYSRIEKLQQVVDFGAINDRPIIGINSAVILVKNAATGAVLLKNTKINPKTEWEDAVFMWWLRFRSYGFSTALKISPLWPKIMRLRTWLKGFSIREWCCVSNIIDPTAKIFKSKLVGNVQIREFCTIRNSKLGLGCKVYERVSIKKSEIGEGSDINAGTYIENADIGKNVQIAPNCSIVGVTHDFSPEGVNHADVFKRISIGDGAWIGAGSIIMPGVKIGKGAVIGAGAVVKMNVSDGFVYMGTPLQNRYYKILSLIHP